MAPRSPDLSVAFLTDAETPEGRAQLLAWLGVDPATPEASHEPLPPTFSTPAIAVDGAVCRKDDQGRWWGVAVTVAHQH